MVSMKTSSGRKSDKASTAYPYPFLQKTKPKQGNPLRLPPRIPHTTPHHTPHHTTPHTAQAQRSTSHHSTAQHSTAQHRQGRRYRQRQGTGQSPCKTRYKIETSMDQDRYGTRQQTGSYATGIEKRRRRHSRPAFLREALVPKLAEGGVPKKQTSNQANNTNQQSKQAKKETSKQYKPTKQTNKHSQRSKQANKQTNKRMSVSSDYKQQCSSAEKEGTNEPTTAVGTYVRQ